MNFMRERALKQKIAILNPNIKRLDAAFRALKKDAGFVTARLTRDHHDSGQVRAELACEKMGVETLRDTSYAYCGIIKKGWTTLSEKVVVFWCPSRPQDRQRVIAAIEAQGLTVTNPDEPEQAVIVDMLPDSNEAAA